MPNFTLSEILTIALVILIVFGPERLPEMAQKAGELIRKSRSMVTDLRREFEGEWREVSEPLKEVTKEISGMKEDMGVSLSSLTDDVAKAKKELEDELADTKKILEEEVKEANKEVKEIMAEPEATSDESPASDDGDDGAEQ